MRATALACVIVLLAASAVAQTKELTTVFDDANRLYLEQKYAEAIDRYRSIVNNGYESGELYFNLGNAYYKSGHIAEAILNYERAKRFMPNDEDLQINLRMANLQLVDKVDAIPKLFVYRWFDAALTVIPLRTLAWVLYALFILTLGSFAAFLYARTYEQKRSSLLGGIGLSVLLAAGIAVFVGQSYREANTESAIVMADVANIKSAPDNSGNDLFVLHRGLKVQVLDSVNKWKKIRLEDGKVGWVPEQDVETI